MVKNKGFFITLEGIEGSGKSTQARLISRWLSQKGLPFIATREPGGTDIGSQIRSILLSEGSDGMCSSTEVLLYLADRFQHISTVVAPALGAGNVVLCDRYHDSTLAYQVFARGVPESFIQCVCSEKLHEFIVPDLTLLFDLPVDIGLTRARAKLQQLNLDEGRFEKEATEFHGKVRAGFLALARREPDRFRIVEASRGIEQISRDVVGILDEVLEKQNVGYK